MNKNKEYLTITTILILVDQIIKYIISTNIYSSSKELINNVLNITYTQNTGGAYGIGNGNIQFFIISNLIIIIFIIVLVFLSKYKCSNKEKIGLTFILAGGCSNLIDRICKGYVVDYIDINPIIKYPIFNFADICIVFGIILIIVANLMKMGEEAK